MQLRLGAAPPAASELDWMTLVQPGLTVIAAGAVGKGLLDISEVKASVTAVEGRLEEQEYAIFCFK